MRKELSKTSDLAVGSTRLVRQVECPKCGMTVEDKGEKDELGCTWFADCQCGWWRELYMPNDAGQWRAAQGARKQTQTPSARPLH